MSSRKGFPPCTKLSISNALMGRKRPSATQPFLCRTRRVLSLARLCSIEDITALREAQEALQLTQFSVDHAVEGFFWIDLDGRILNVNEAACRMLGDTRDELRAMTLHAIDPNFPPELWSAHWKELKQKGSMTFESKHWSRTGSRVGHRGHGQLSAVRGERIQLRHRTGYRRTQADTCVTAPERRTLPVLGGQRPDRDLCERSGTVRLC